MDIVICLRFGWVGFKLHMWRFLLITSVLGAFQCTVNILLQLTVHPVLGMFVSIVCSGLIAAGILNAARQAADGQHPTLAAAFAPFVSRPVDHLIVSLALSLGVFIMGVGIVASVLLFLFAPLFVVEGVSWDGALKASKQLILGNVWVSAGLVTVLIALNLLGALPFGLGQLVTVPVSALAILQLRALCTARASGVSIDPA